MQRDNKANAAPSTLDSGILPRKIRARKISDTLRQAEAAIALGLSDLRKLLGLSRRVGAGRSISIEVQQ
jgi:hypothetical protein